MDTDKKLIILMDDEHKPYDIVLKVARQIKRGYTSGLTPTFHFETENKKSYLDAIKIIWDVLGLCSIDRDECIQQQFLHFEIGTPRENIWKWFEETFDISVTDLMFSKHLQR